MNVNIFLDKPHPHFTNLDFITGRVVLRITSGPAAITSVIVKLEGESRTRLLAPIRPGEAYSRKAPLSEIHKVLYKVQNVFPPANAPQPGPLQRNIFMVNAGQYEYPFQFKIPFNKACHDPSSVPARDLVHAFPTLRMQMQSMTRHVKKTLPPSLSGFPGEAEITYFVKVTVNRKEMWKENPRGFVGFNFLPIEPPRPPATGSSSETYARQQHQFLLGRPELSPRDKSFLNGLRNGSSPTNSTGGDPPRISVEARLPHPAILTCNEDLPLRILVKRQSQFDGTVYLDSLHIELISYTKIRAMDAYRTESRSWVITSKSNMAMPLLFQSTTLGAEAVVSNQHWTRKPLPNTVVPSFDTCNISRFYELKVHVGLSYGAPGGRQQAQSILLPLRLKIQVFSGITPPPELLAAVAAGPQRYSEVSAQRAKQQSAAQSVGSASQQTPIPPLNGPSPFTRTHSTHSAISRRPVPQPPNPLSQEAESSAAGASSHQVHPVNIHGEWLDAPPSYDEAMAEDVAPVDGPRREFVVPATPEGAPRFSNDEEGNRNHYGHAQRRSL